MGNEAGHRVRLTAAEGQKLGEAAMRGAGYGPDEARILAEHAMDAALSGYEYSGLPKLLNVVDDPHFSDERKPISIVKDAGAAVLVDGGWETGMIAAYRASEIAIDRATVHGLAIVCLANTWMTGRSALYCEMIAKAGLVAIHTVSAPSWVAPFGGAARSLGTNPIAFGFPTSGDPLLIDMGTSAFMGTDLQFRERIGAALPDGVAIGPSGEPTTDASEARQGALLPFGGPEGGYKGFGLALAMDAIGALAGGIRPANTQTGYLFIAIKPDLFMSLDEYRREVSHRINVIKSTPRQPGISEIRIPGERGMRERAKRLKEGIEIEGKIFDALNRLAAGNLDHGG
jgi:LDH2 family malate/lactate/ureidoglycolate dehydrogenase